MTDCVVTFCVQCGEPAYVRARWAAAGNPQEAELCEKHAHELWRQFGRTTLFVFSMPLYRLEKLMEITRQVIGDPKYQVQGYSRLFSSGCWSVTLLPSLWIDKHYEFKSRQFGTGEPPGLHVLKITFCWFIWQLSIVYQWDRNGRP